MSTINIFEYSNYRRFLSDWLRANKLSYREFAARYRFAVSFIALAKMLSKGRGGTKQKNDYRMSPESLARLGKALGLSEDELLHLLLLRLENDSEALAGKYGNTFQVTMRRALSLSEAARSKKNNASDYNASNKYSKEIKLIAEIIEYLPKNFRAKIIEEILLQGNIYASRQMGKPGVKPLSSLLAELSRL